MRILGFGQSITSKYRLVVAKIPKSSEICEVLEWSEKYQTYQMERYNQEKSQNALKYSELRTLIKNLTTKNKFMTFKKFRLLRSKIFPLN